MSEMVGRVFEAISAYMDGCGENRCVPPMSDGCECALAARAAIEAMRDVECLPMLLAGKNALFSCSEDPTIEAAHDCFRAMLAVALTDKQPF